MMKRNELVALGVLAAAIIGAHFEMRELVWTGDEPRYTFMAASLFEQGDIGMDEARWSEFTEHNRVWAVPYDHVSRTIHSRTSSLILAPVVGLGGLKAARWFNLLIGLAGFFATYWTLRQSPVTAGPHGLGPLTRRDNLVPLLAMAVGALTIPALPYLRLIYSEIMTMALLAGALAFMSQTRDAPPRYAALALALFLPFVHIRGALVAGVLILFQFLPWLRRPSIDPAWLRRIAFAAIALVGFVAVQLYIYGSLTGSASFNGEVTLPSFFERVGIQLFSVRHGLLVYSPIHILSLAGLAIGVARRDRLSLLGSCLLVAYLLSFVWGTASESMPARFWCTIIPVFGIGLANWLREPRGVLGWAAASPLLLITLLNTVWLILEPNHFLENRLSSRSYEAIFDVFPFLHLGVFLPWDSLGHWHPHMEQSWAYSQVLLLAVAVFVAGQVLAAQARNARVGQAGELAGLVVAVLLLSAARLTVLPPDAIALEEHAVTDGRFSVTLKFQEPVNPGVLRVGNHRKVRWAAVSYHEVEIEASQDGLRFEPLLRTGERPLIPLPDHGPISSLRVTWPESPDPERLESRLDVLVRP